MAAQLNVAVRQEGGYWSVFVNDVRCVDRESFTVAHNIAREIVTPSGEPTECGNVADTIREHFAS